MESDKEQGSNISVIVFFKLKLDGSITLHKILSFIQTKRNTKHITISNNAFLQLGFVTSKRYRRYHIGNIVH